LFKATFPFPKNARAAIETAKMKRKLEKILLNTVYNLLKPFIRANLPKEPVCRLATAPGNTLL
jgi:hypothetical protein